MANFPLLKTGAVAQYPLIRTVRYSTCVLRFVDGTEQRFREHNSPVRRWVIRLDLLDEEELSRIDEFFVSEQGHLGDFSFTDPWDGMEYPSCSLENDIAELSFHGPARGTATLTVKENIN
jgi:hypothetical protein